MFWNNFPYTDVHNINLDWIIKTVKMLFNSAVFSINGHTPDADGNVQLTGTELGTVGTVNGKSPDSNGNVNVGTVRTINGQTPDANGAIEVGKVRTVNGFAPNEQGDVNAGTVRSVNGKSPMSLPTPGSITLTASDVGAIPDTVDPVETVNGISPDANGNVNVGTVKSVNGSTPDANGNVNLPTVAGVTSVCGIGPDAQGNVELTASDVDAIPTTEYITSNLNIYLDAVNGNDTNNGLTSETPIKTISKFLQIISSITVSSGRAIIANFATGTYSEILNLVRLPVPVTLKFATSVIIGGIHMGYCAFPIQMEGSEVTIKYDSNLAYTGGNRLFNINSSDVYITCDIVIDSTGLNNANGIYGQFATIKDAKKITFTGSFAFCLNLTSSSYAKIKTIIAPTTNVGAVTTMSDLLTETINSGTDYTGTAVNNGGKIELR